MSDSGGQSRLRRMKAETKRSVMVILCVSLTELRDAQVAGKTLFQGVPVKVLLDEISIGMGTLGKKDDAHQVEEASSNLIRLEQKGRKRVNVLSCLNWGFHLLMPSDLKTWD